MAEVFTNATLRNISNTVNQTVYTAPTGTQSVVHSLFISNKSSSDVRVDIAYDNLAVSTYLGKDVFIPANATLVWDKPINILPTHRILMQSDTLDSCDVFMSVLEIS